MNKILQKPKYSVAPWNSDKFGDIYDRNDDLVGCVFDNPDSGMEEPDDEPSTHNRLLIEQAPAMDLVLRLLATGLARIEPGTIIEFCFSGMRHQMDGDYNKLLESVGWEKAVAAITPKMEPSVP